MKEETAKSTTATIKTANPVWKLCGSKQTNEANCGVYCHIQRRMHGAEHTIVPTSHCYPTFIWCMYAVWQRVWVWVCGARVHCELFFELLLFVDSVTVVCCCLLLLLMLLLLVGARSCCVCERARVCVCVYVCVFFCLVCAVNRRHVTFQQQFLFRPIHVQQQQQQLTLLHWLCMCKCKCACLFCSHNTKKRSFKSSRSSSIYTHSRHTIETDFGCLFYRRALLLYCISVSSDKPTYSDRFSFEAARFFSISEILKEKIEQE